ncbi:MAG: DNA-3-methyladenine glycosylase I [Candidatus Promineifilaceae bacterium]|jgi:DNA-3-methyladenine glycosylase I
MPISGAPKQIDPDSLDEYLEVMSKAVFQSGMSWQVVEAKWPGTREAFHNFSIKEVADFNAFDLEELAKDQRVIRNKRKLAAVVHNAQRMLELDDEYGTFQQYLRSYGEFDAILKAMKQDFKFMGPTGVYYFLYVVGEEVPPHEEFEAQYRK